MASLKNTTINDTGFIQLPSGTTAQRPTAAAGMMRYNSTLGCTEIYNSATATWNCLCEGTYTAELLLVGGGGGGGAATGGGGGGGGGAGGVVYVSSYTITGGTSYSITVGAGGPGALWYHFGTGTRNLSPGGSMYSRGGDTTGFGYTAYGGGNGGGAGGNATQGGSGGGARRDCASGCNAGSITTGQGNAGGNAGQNSCGSAGGGGGAGSVGQNGCADCQSCRPTSTCGNGGDGVQYNWLGDGGWFGGGGGGAFESSLSIDSAVGDCEPPRGGRGGGGWGSMHKNQFVQADSSHSAINMNGQPGTGGGGGGAQGSATGGSGGSGIVMIRYAGPPIGIGGNVVQYNGYTIHVFRGSGTFIG